MKTIAKERETIADIALKECGSVEAMFDIARLNGIALSDEPQTGQNITLPTIYERQVVRYYNENSISPASGTADTLPQNTVISSDGLSIVSILDGEIIIY